MIDDAIAEARIQVSLGHGHAEGIGDALAERTGGHFDAELRIVFRMAGTVRSEFAEVAHLLQRDVFVAGEVEQAVEQHRAVAIGEHHAVAVRPGRIGGVKAQVAGVECGGDLGHAQRHALMAFGGAHDGVDGKKADGMRQRLQGMWGHDSKMHLPGKRGRCVSLRCNGGDLFFAVGTGAGKR